MTVALIARDLIIASRIAAAAERAGVDLIRVSDPADLPPSREIRLLLVDWGDRSADWGERIVTWCAAAPEAARPRILLFGPHVDLEAHAAARAAGLGPMRARSAFFSQLPKLVEAAVRD
ncbi:MAG: hypothetical protein WED86_05615 [Chloroflexota bacterium]